MPFDPVPTQEGEWRLVAAPPGQYPRCMHVPVKHRAALAGELLTPHWATCPNAAQHRRRK